MKITVTVMRNGIAGLVYTPTTEIKAFELLQDLKRCFPNKEYSFKLEVE